MRKITYRKLDHLPCLRITGREDEGRYTLELVIPGRGAELLYTVEKSATGIKDVRTWIDSRIDSHPEWLIEDNHINECCVKPGRIEDKWRQCPRERYLEGYAVEK